MAEPVFKPAVLYRDAGAALDWLERAFDFETTLKVTNAEGEVVHAEMGFRDGFVGIGVEWDFGAMRVRAPASMNGDNTQFTSVMLEEGIDAHCERARAAGARIIEEPKDQFYGDRTYRALDLEGHLWTFRMKTRAISHDAMERETGLKIKAPEQGHG